jgi:NTE family protein
MPAVKGQASSEPARTSPPADRLGLCLSGGGYRAMLFHAGAVWRLYEFGLLQRVSVVSAVSGGSIVAAWLGATWAEIDFDRADSEAFRRTVVDPLRGLASRTIDLPSGLQALLDPQHGSGELLARRLARQLFAERTLQDLPAAPRITINATNVQSLSGWQFSRERCGDDRVGWVPEPNVALATAVAASAAYPPLLSAVRLALQPEEFLPGSGSDLAHEPYTSGVVLGDGSSIDALGLAAAWDECGTVLISDALRPGRPRPRAPRTWAYGLQRAREILEHELHDVRVAAATADFAAGRRRGVYWEIADASVLATAPGALTGAQRGGQGLSQITTRLRRLPSSVQEALIDWGYAIADAAVRGSLHPELPAPRALPYA